MSDAGRELMSKAYPRRYAPAGSRWQCACCGKFSNYDAYGIIGRYDKGWDESCALNSVLVPSPDVTKLETGNEQSTD